MPSLENTLCKWYSPVRGLMNCLERGNASPKKGAVIAPCVHSDRLDGKAAEVTAPADPLSLAEQDARLSRQ